MHTEKRRPRREQVRLAIAAASGMALVGAIVPWAAAGTGDSRAAAKADAAAAVVQVAAEVETQPEFDDDAGGDADADDPAIWVNPDNKAKSLVLATLKNAGLSVFSLDGKQIQRIAAPAAPGPDDEPGRFNNVDILTGFTLGGKKTDIAVATDRGRDQLRVFSIDKKKLAAGKAPLTDVTDPSAPLLFSKDQAEANGQANAYGISLWQDGGKSLALVSREETTTLGVVQLSASGRAKDKVNYKLLRTRDLPATFDLPDGTTFTPCEDPGEQPHSEGLFVDPEDGVAYVGQEDIGLWRMDADLKKFKPVLIDKTKEFGVPATFDPVADECVVSGPDPGFGGKNLSADVEGTTIFDAGDGEGYLMISSQGNNTIAVYEREGKNKFVGTFRIGNGKGEVDSVEETDGMAVTNVGVGAFKEGLLALQDGSNTPDIVDEAGEARENSNFKFVSWGKIAAGFDPPLDVNPKG